MTAVLAYFIAALSPNMDVANAALPTYVVVSDGSCVCRPHATLLSAGCICHCTLCCRPTHVCARVHSAQCNV